MCSTLCFSRSEDGRGCNLTHIFAEKGSYTSGEYIGEDRCQNLKMGFLSSAFSLLWGSAFGVTAHDAVHGAAHDAFMTLPAYTRTREDEAPQLGSGPTPCRQSF